MAKSVKTYSIFIAAPGDIKNEKRIIHDCVTQWNKLIGSQQHVRIEVTDWSDTYPQYGERPQAIINEQIFDKCDIVVALFWTKFGTPTGIAASGTEEEILRAISSGKHLLLYFKDAPLPLDRIEGNEYDKIQDFQARHKDKGLYRVYTSDEGFKDLFLTNLVSFMKDLIEGKFDKKTSETISTKTADEEIKEADETGAKYQPVKDLEKKIKENFPAYWAKLYGIVEPKSQIANHIKITKDSKQEVGRLKEKVKKWGEDVKNYSESLTSILDRIEEIGADELKNDILPDELWTVGTALSSFDNELWLFKQHYEAMAAFEIKDTVKNILSAVESYKSQVPVTVKNNSIGKPEALGFDKILHPNQTLLTGVIGKGIRSEILHKLSPKFFSLMTRRSIWAMFFLTNEASEFIVDQTRDGQWRTVHNWDYLYDRFTYFNHIVFQLIQENLAKHKIKLDSNFKYGYVNLFLVDVFKSHNKEIENLKKLKFVG
ncbi:hypothetical protein ACFJIV_33060 [Mucilaginibacter sp. UC70_90]